jgi:DNA-binding CsgD family transcriptional regulator
MADRRQSISALALGCVFWRNRSAKDTFLSVIVANSFRVLASATFGYAGHEACFYPVGFGIFIAMSASSRDPVRHDVFDLVHAITEETDITAICRLTRQFADLFDFDSWVYGNYRDGFVGGDQPIDWSQLYPDIRAIAVLDPITHGALKLHRAMPWSLVQLKAGAKYSRDATKALSIRHDMGLHFGITTPAFTEDSFRGLGVTSFNWKKKHDGLTDRARGEVSSVVQLFGQVLHSRASELHVLAKAPTTVVLLPREKQCLELVGLGISTKRAAGMLQLQVPTVNFHLYSAARKMGVRGRTQAVLKAAELGLLKLR